MQRLSRGKKKNSRRSHGTHTFPIISPVYMMHSFAQHDLVSYKTVKTNKY